MVKNKKAFLIYGLIFAFFAILSYLFPYTGDDWAWGSEIGLQRLQSGFSDYNGRYAGNILVLLLTRNKLLNVLFMSTTFFVCCTCCDKYVTDKKESNITYTLLAVILFLVMPRDIFAQSVVWTSGFANYVPSVIISAIYVIMFKKIFYDELRPFSNKMTVAIFFMALVGALFIEHITIFNVFLGTFAVIYCRVKYKKHYVFNYSFLIGSVIGSIIMFSNSAYHNVIQGADPYRSVSSNIFGFLYTIFTHTYEIISNLILSNYVMCLIISVLTVVLVYNSYKNNKHKNVVKISTVVNILCLISFFGYFIYNRLPLPVNLLTKFVMILIAIVYVISLTVNILLCIKGRERIKILFPLFCILVMCAPLLIVNPIGPRCFFSSYLFLMIFTIALFDYVTKKVKRNSMLFFPACFAALAVIYMSIFIPIHYVDAERNNFAKEQSRQGQKEILICPLPDKGYLWTSEPENDPWDKRYKLFYGLEKDVTFKFITQEELFTAIELSEN